MSDSFSSLHLISFLFWNVLSKSRPTNGPGANHLRGGTRLYSEKTAVGGWIERSGGPSGYHRGFSTDEFETEAQHQQYGLGKPKFYGAGLPLDEEIVHPREVKDIFHPRSGPAPKDWKSNTHSMMESVLVPKVNSYLYLSNIFSFSFVNVFSYWFNVRLNIIIMMIVVEQLVIII